MNRVKQMMKEWERKGLKHHKRYRDDDEDEDYRYRRDHYDYDDEDDDDDYEDYDEYEDEDDDYEDDEYEHRGHKPHHGSRHKHGGRSHHKEMEMKRLKKALRGMGEEVWEYVEDIKDKDPELYCILKCELWRAIYGPHFTEEFAREAIAKVAEAFGRNDVKYDMKEAEDLAVKYGMRPKDFNRADWFYAINVVRYMFLPHTGENPEAHVRLAYHWLQDKTLNHDKSFWHYCQFVKCRGGE